MFRNTNQYLSLISPRQRGGFMSSDDGRERLVFEKWLDSLKEKDPALHAELTSRLRSRVEAPAQAGPRGAGITLESVAPGSDVRALALETIVREGRPALLIRDNRISHDQPVADTTARVMIDRLKEATPILEPLIPLVGRI